MSGYGDLARRYAGHGLAVVPMHEKQENGSCTCRKGAECATPGKHPRILWKDRPAEPPTEAEIENWWSRMCPEAPVGCILGDAFAAIDVDERPGVPALDVFHDLEMAYEPLPETWRQTTPHGGFQAIFATNGMEVKPADLAENVELRTGRLILRLPPGPGREWEVEPGECELAELPKWVAELAGRQNGSQAGATAGRGRARKVARVQPGAMYEHLKDRAIRLVRAGMVDEEAVARALTAEFEAVRVPGAAYGGDAEDTHRLAEWAVQSEIAAREAERKAEVPEDDHARVTIDPPDTAELLDEVIRFVKRFVVLPGEASYRTISLYTLHTWAIDAAFCTPYLVVESPEKQSGKTRLLEVLELVCRNPVKAASVTAAAIFQTVAAGRPTLLLDEADAIFAGNSERCEDLRGVLNAGNAPGSVVIRGGRTGEPVRFDVYCPKVVSGIKTGKLPDTIRDRAIVIPIDRKLKAERVERLRRRRINGEVEELRTRVQAWAGANEEELSRFDLSEPVVELTDRLEEAWEPLFAIAALAERTELARADAVALAGVDEDNEGDWTHRLLVELKEVFKNKEVMFTRDILVELNMGDGWDHFNNGAGLKSRDLGTVAKRYKIPSHQTVRDGTDTAKGYRREWFQEAWVRYGVTEKGSHGHNPVVEPKIGGSKGSQDPQCDPSKNAATPLPERDVTPVTLLPAPTHVNGVAGHDCDGLVRQSTHRLYCLKCGWEAELEGVDR